MAQCVECLPVYGEPLLAGDEGIEPPTSVLETEVIPFN